MPRKFTFLALLASVTLWLANSNNPPGGRTGAPSEGLCSDCHSNGAGQQGTIALTGLPVSIEPGQAYVLTITNTKTAGTAASEAGFQVTILNSANQKAGTFSGPDPNSALETFNTRQYWEHDPSQNYPGSNMVTWTVTWTAPVNPPNTTITAYCAGNIADGNGGSSNDRIVTAQFVGMLNGGANPLMVSITNSANVLCFGGNTGSATATATEGVAPYTYNWSNGGSGQTISNLTAGTYVVTVTDNAAGTATANVVISQPTNLLFGTPTITSVSCNGGNNGSITATATGGIAPYFFNWSTGSQGATVSNLAAGTYTVTVTDNNDCTKSTNYMVTQPASIVINLVTLVHESCANEEDGSISISTSGGVAPLFAEWSNGSVGNTINNLEPGTYSVTVTDNNDCTETASYTVNAGGTVTVDLVNIDHVTCPGGNDGAITVIASGGMAPYTYAWSNGGNGPAISNLAAGNYLVTVTDNKGCTAVNFYTVTQPTAFNITIAQSGSNLCFGDANVDLTASVAGGSPPYSSLWSNGVVGLTNNNLAAGTYTITITDSDGCSGTGSSTVSQPAQLTVTVSTTDETGVGANDGTATANVSGGTGASTYAWSNGGSTSTITALAPGTYTVTVTDANGCSTTASGQVDAFGCSLDVTLPVDVTICSGQSTVINSTVIGATGAVTYAWSTGASSPDITVTLGGEYCVSVTDQAGCQDVDCITITEIIVGPLNCVVTNESAPGQNDGAIACDVIVGATYLWSNGATTPTITGLAPGEYCLTVTDINGCTATDCANVSPGNCNLSITSIVSDVLCAGDSTGSISVTVENASPPVTYTWSNGGTTSSISNVPSGSYSVTIADAAGCVETRDFAITEPAAITIAVDTVIDITVGVTGSILITVTGGVPPYTYLWTNPAGANDGNEDQTQLSLEGNYAVVITDANGCQVGEDSIFVDMEVGLGDEPRFAALKVYPVPTQDYLQVDMDQPIREYIISGVDGRTLLRSENVQQNRIDVSGIEVGWYILRISDGSRWYIARFVK